MGTARDLAASTLVDSILPYLHRALEDVVYQVLDQRRVPTRSDLQELERLNAANTAITEEGIRWLERTLPDVEVSLTAYEAPD